MYNFTDIITVNTRRLKKFAKASCHDAKMAQAIADSYKGVFVVVECNDCNITAIQHYPKNPDMHQRVRNVPHQLTRRIRKGNPEWAAKLTIEE